MRLKRALISAVAVLGLSALGLSASANAAALTVSGAGHDQMAGKGKSTFTLIYGGGVPRRRLPPRRRHRLSRWLSPRLRLCGPHRLLWWSSARSLGRRTILGWRRLASRRLVRWLGARMGRASRRLVWWLASSRMGLASRRLVRWLGPRMGLASCRLVWWLASSRMGLAPRWLVWWLGGWLGLARWRRAYRLRVWQRKLLLKLPFRRLWTGLLQRQLVCILLGLVTLEQPLPV